MGRTKKVAAAKVAPAKKRARVKKTTPIAPTHPIVRVHQPHSPLVQNKNSVIKRTGESQEFDTCIHHQVTVDGFDAVEIEMKPKKRAKFERKTIDGRDVLVMAKYSK